MSFEKNINISFKTKNKNTKSFQPKIPINRYEYEYKYVSIYMHSTTFITLNNTDFLSKRKVKSPAFHRLAYITDQVNKFIIIKTVCTGIKEMFTGLKFIKKELLVDNNNDKKNPNENENHC